MKCAALFCLLPITLFAAQIVVEEQNGETSIFEVDLQEESLDHFLCELEKTEKITNMLVYIPYGERVSFRNVKAERMSGTYLGYPRDYPGGLTTEELNDIHFIVRTLADKSLITIAKERYSLEAAGDRIDHVHPLNFLLTIFSDEELKVAVRNIRGKGWVWSNFLSGLKQTLSTESEINNVMPHMQDFSSRLEVGIHLLLPAVRSRNWDLLVDQLIKNVPRKGDGSRYDM